jgi:hypothetical protein
VAGREPRAGVDDATLDRVERVHREQLAFVDIYTEQLRRWRVEHLSARQRQELDRMDDQNNRLRQVTMDVLALAAELRNGTIERIMEQSDLELGLQALLGKPPQTDANPPLIIACNTLPHVFARWAFWPH